MPHYFFHACGPSRRVPDTEGIELNDIQAAYDLAIQIVRDITGGRLGFPEASGWTIEVADRDSEITLAVPFVNAFKPTSSERT